MKLTEQQQAAVDQRGRSLLVSASAGSGKTEVLARRCMSLIADGEAPCGVDRVLVATFTRAAAAELRSRIGKMLRERTAETRDRKLRDHLRRQEALLDSAEIGTIDAWCARIVREHFAATETGIDPAFSVLSAEQAAILRSEVGDQLFEWIYTADDPPAEAARRWIMRHTRPNDSFLRELIDKLNQFRQHLIDPDRWFVRQIKLHGRPEAELKRDSAELLARALRAELEFQREQLGGVISAVSSEAVRNQLLAYGGELEAWTARLKDPQSVVSVAEDIKSFGFKRKSKDTSGADVALREEVKKRWHEKRLKERWKPEGVSEVIENAGRAAELTITLLELEEQHRQRLESAKRARGAYEFGDVQRMALDLLGAPCDASQRRPTSIALMLQERYEHILVDEYQDTSPVQAELLRLVSRSGEAGSNRFMVGDIKQSIYGFREAEPRLFAELIDAFSAGREDGEALFLSDSFRSHADLVDGLNTLFAMLFDRALGGAAYGEDQHLRARRDEIANPALDSEPRIETHVLFDGARTADDESDSDDDAVPLERIEREARVAATRIRALLDDKACIPQRQSGGSVALRPLELSDVVILLRSAKVNATLMAGTLRQAGVSAVACGRESVLDAIEVRDVRGALSLLCNRNDDVAMAAYLRGPMADVSAAELLEIRRASPGAPFCEAVEVYREAGADRALADKLDRVIGRLEDWASASRSEELPEIVRRILRDTGMVSFARALPGGEHRVAMLRAFERIADDFSQRGRRGVAEFTQYLDALDAQDERPDVTPAAGADAVRVMTIHAAKGLEFPVVFLCGAGTEFSRRPRPGALLCTWTPGADDAPAIGLDFFDYPTRTKLSTPASLVNRHAVAQRELEEELRLLYVAATRARERLIVVGHAAESAWEDARERFAAAGAPPLITRLSAASMLEWVLMATAAGGLASPDSGGVLRARVSTYRAGEVASPEAREAATEDVQSGAELEADDLDWVAGARVLLESELDLSISRRPAVLSVSAAKRQAAHYDHGDQPRAVEFSPTLRAPEFARSAGARDGAAIGNAYHRFMQWADLQRLTSVAEVRSQIDELVGGGTLAAEDAELIGAEDLVWFGGTEVGKRVAACVATCRREISFAQALAVWGDSERTLLRGVIDCLFETADGLVILDYKSDRPSDAADFAARVDAYGVQLQLYALAAGDVFQREVCEAALVFLRERQVVSVNVDRAALDRAVARIGEYAGV